MENRKGGGKSRASAPWNVGVGWLGYGIALYRTRVKCNKAYFLYRIQPLCNHSAVTIEILRGLQLGANELQLDANELQLRTIELQLDGNQLQLKLTGCHRT